MDALKYDMAFTPPLMNAAGSLGFAPELHESAILGQFGAFVTNPISLGVRSPAHGLRCQAFPGGFLLHTGYPNPGLRAVIRRYARRWAQGGLPVIVHLLAGRPEEISRMVRLLEGLEGVTGIELGLAQELDADAAWAQVQAALGELPVVARLPFEQAAELGPVAIAAGAVMVSLAPPRGALPGAGGSLVYGRLYGPALYPAALALVQRMAQANLPVIASGGIYHPSQVEAMLAVGARAVQLDSVLWRGGWPVTNL